MPETDDVPARGASRPPRDDAATPPTADPPDPVRDTRSDDDSDVGWGDDPDRSGPGGGRDLRWYEEQRPPHWE